MESCQLLTDRLEFRAHPGGALRAHPSPLSHGISGDPKALLGRPATRTGPRCDFASFSHVRGSAPAAPALSRGRCQVTSKELDTSPSIPLWVSRYLSRFPQEFGGCGRRGSHRLLTAEGEVYRHIQAQARRERRRQDQDVLRPIVAGLHARPPPKYTPMITSCFGCPLDQQPTR